MTKKTLGQKLIEAVHEAIHKKGKGKVVRPKINVAVIRKKNNLQ